MADNTLDACVSRLRSKLASIGTTATIDTVHGVSYRVAPEPGLPAARGQPG